MNELITFITSFNNRESAIVIYLSIFLAFLVIHPKIRADALGLLKLIFTTRVFLLTIITTLLYVVVWMFALSRIGIWDSALYPVIVFWFFGEALVLMLRVNELDKDQKPFKKLFLQMFKVTVLIEFTSNFFVFSFWQELVLIPFIILFSILLAASEFKAEDRELNKYLNKFSLVLGWGILLTFTYRLCTSFYDFASIETLKQFIFPFILSIGLAPIIYILLLIIKYDELFIRFRKKYNPSFDKPKKARWLIIKTFGLNYFKFRDFLAHARQRTFKNYEKLNTAVKAFLEKNN